MDTSRMVMEIEGKLPQSENCESIEIVGDWATYNVVLNTDEPKVQCNTFHRTESGWEFMDSDILDV